MTAPMSPEELDELVKRLRSKDPLPLCPYDRRSPDYWTAPDDKPCRVCGTVNDVNAPDLCRGADTRIMDEAADALAALGQARPWPISTDGPEAITETRRWLARQLMDSRLTEAEALGIVAFHPSIKDAAAPSPDRTSRLEAALIKARDQFLFYAEQHRAKENTEGDRKAAVNAHMADLIDQALATNPGEPSE